ncbi:MAG: hypothetical protein ACE14S_07100 [Candidatus Bathyarchaeia archaeon]
MRKDIRTIWELEKALKEVGYSEHAVAEIIKWYDQTHLYAESAV